MHVCARPARLITRTLIRAPPLARRHKYMSAAVLAPTAASPHGVSLSVILRYSVDGILRETNVLYRGPTDVAFLHLPKFFTVLGRADDVPQVDVHPCVAIYQAAIVRVAALELDEHRLTGGRSQQR